MKQETKVIEEETNQGWISLNRSILDTEIMKDSSLFHVFGYLLLRATHKAKTVSIDGKKIHLKIGQVIVGRLSCAKKLNMSKNTWAECIKTLAEYKTIKADVIKGRGKKNLATLVTIPKFAYYQSKEGRVKIDPLMGQNRPMDGSKMTLEEPLMGQNRASNNKIMRISNKEHKDLKSESQTIKLTSLTDKETPLNHWQGSDKLWRPWDGQFYKVVGNKQDGYKIQVKSTGKVYSEPSMFSTTFELEYYGYCVTEKNELITEGRDLPYLQEVLFYMRARKEYKGDSVSQINDFLTRLGVTPKEVKP